MPLQSFRHRSLDLERLDTGDYTREEYARWQGEMRLINRFLGDTRALWLSLDEELVGCNGQTVSILDVGAGAGELLTATKEKLGNLAGHLVGFELNGDAALSIRNNGLSSVQGDALILPFAADSFDFVVSSLFLHHLSDEKVIILIKEMSRVARRSFFIIDLHRHAAAYYLYRLFGPLVLQRFTVEDGSLSIRRSFRPDELKILAQKAGIENIKVKRRAAFRLVLSGSKNAEANHKKGHFERNEQYDVAIVGAGPAGSAAAIRLALSGLRVALVEQKRFPREKLCGEFISPECLDHFAELGVLDQISLAGAVDLDRTVFYAANGRSVAVPSEWFGTGSSAIGLSRAAMDDVLLGRARAASVTVFDDTQAMGLVVESDKIRGVNLRDSNGLVFEIRSPLTIDATGRSRFLGRQVEKVKGTKADYVAFKTHLTGVSVPDGDCEIYAYRGGYGGCGKVEKDRHNLCFVVKSEIVRCLGGDAERIMQEVVFKNKQAARSLQNAKVVEAWLAVPIESYGRFSLAPAHGLLAVGDAAAFIDPFTGSGILLALESARIAARAITANPGGSFASLADDYKRLHAAAFNRRLQISSLLRHAAFVPFLSESVIRLLATSEWMTRRVARATR